MSQKKTKPFRLPDRTITQLAELVNGEYFTTETSAVVEAVNYLYYHKVEQANQITLASRMVAERQLSPEIINRNGELWLNLGSGLLAESAAAIIVQQFGSDAKAEQDAVGDWLIWHKSAGQDAYALLKCIIMFRL
jgi:hypothetical protein